MQQAAVPTAARDAISGHLASLGLPHASREGLLRAMETGLAAGEPDAFALRDRLVAQATAHWASAVGAVALEIAEAVVSPTEAIGEGA